jgi:cupin fold WbuC family metalloprotein
VRVHELSPEVLVADGPLVELTAADVDTLKAKAKTNPRRRIRVCAHPDSEDALHEMVIVHMRGAYIPPHRHPGKSESSHVLEGEADLVLFDDDGELADVIPLGAYGSGRRFFCRVDRPTYHSLLIHSDFFVFHEVTNGPFRREETDFAGWAPEDGDPAAEEYRHRLEERVKVWAP